MLQSSSCHDLMGNLGHLRRKARPILIESGWVGVLQTFQQRLTKTGRFSFGDGGTHVGDKCHLLAMKSMDLQKISLFTPKDTNIIKTQI